MTQEEIFSFYDDNWDDYDKIMDMLHNILDNHTEEVRVLKNKVVNTKTNDDVTELRVMLQECQDKLDEETHKVLPR